MSEFILEPERKVPITDKCDVLVAGGGIAGIAAAIAAAREGRSVILLEREYALGGMATLGLVTIYLPLCDGNGNQVVFGLGEELLKLSIEHVVEANYPKAWLEGGSLEDRIRERYITQFNAHLFALRAEKLLRDLGVTILYGTLAAAVTKQGDAIKTVVVENKSGRSAIEVGAVVDATGDADICHLAGAETTLHEGGNGLASWYYYFSQGRVALKMFGLADIAPGAAPPPGAPPEDPYAAAKVESLGTLRFTGVDGAELSRAVITAHEKMYADILAFREKDESFVPVTISTIPLVRMSRRIVGAYTQDDSEDKRRHEDSIGMTGDWRKRGPAYEIPYRTLVGAQVSNLLAAGRDISVTDAMWDITRVIPPCAVTGQAAGIAASFLSDVRSLDVADVQKKLQAAQVKLHLDEIY
ncbi:MAG: FAD-dependent oxidoreductase [Oscillospiraceae bacterium]|jgi:hypothetical protein|nr:FAD-dependent oxidoreductase [Oscillospiraceae bacterium]